VRSTVLAAVIDARAVTDGALAAVPAGSLGADVAARVGETLVRLRTRIDLPEAALGDTGSSS
jgi:hypothetical protein